MRLVLIWFAPGWCIWIRILGWCNWCPRLSTRQALNLMFEMEHNLWTQSCKFICPIGSVESPSAADGALGGLEDIACFFFLTYLMEFTLSTIESAIPVQQGEGLAYEFHGSLDSGVLENSFTISVYPQQLLTLIKVHGVCAAMTPTLAMPYKSCLDDMGFSECWDEDEMDNAEKACIVLTALYPMGFKRDWEDPPLKWHCHWLAHSSPDKQWRGCQRAREKL